MRKINFSHILSFSLTALCVVMSSCEEEQTVSIEKKEKAMEQEESEFPKGAIQCISGLTYLTLESGEGKDRPGPEDQVRAVIKSEGNEESIDKVQTLNLGETSAGLCEAFQLMTPSGKMRVWIPASLQNDGAKETVVYDLELIDFKRLKEPRVIPNDLVSPSHE